MQSYSLNGYLKAVLRRTDKTLLVEGVTDQSVMTRLKRERSAELGFEPIGSIDVSALVQDVKTQGIGKKEVIRLVIAEIDSLPENMARKSNQSLVCCLTVNGMGLTSKCSLLLRGRRRSKTRRIL